jgi:hypothetical protein
MAVRLRSARTSSNSGSSNGDAQPDNRLAMLDHAFFRGQRAIEQKQVVQVVWVYEHAVDFEGLKRFNHNLGHGLLGRRIECSPLPFARHRWVSYREPADIDVATCARPRADVSDWADERSQLPTDPESSSGWHLGVLPLSDGSTAVSLVISHCLLDGLGLIAVLIDAVTGNTRDLGLPSPSSRSRLRAAAQDARLTALDVPEATRALVALAKLAARHRHELRAAAKTARHHRNEIAEQPVPRPVALSDGDGDESVIVPAITMHIDIDEWNSRAKVLGGTSNALMAALAVKLGEHLGRRRASDGAVTLQLPMSDRTEGDNRANAMSFARVTVAPERVTEDLGDVRAAIRKALIDMREMPDGSTDLLWLTQFAPRRALNRLSSVMVVGDPDLPVFCSNLGDLGSVVCRLDGTDAEYATARAIGQNETRRSLEQAGGMMRMQCWRLRDRVFITVVAYQPGAENTKPALREVAARTLADFDLTGEIE